VSGYTKLFSSLIHSTIWDEADHVRIVWVTMLALADRDGLVEASVPGLAKAARVALEACEEALAKLHAPDPYSRSPEHEGRRIETVRGGWRILNHGAYTYRLSAEDRREKTRERVRRHRARLAGNAEPVTVTLGNTPVTLGNARNDTQTQTQTKTQIQSAAPSQDLTGSSPGPPRSARAPSDATSRDAFGKTFEAQRPRHLDATGPECVAAIERYSLPPAVVEMRVDDHRRWCKLKGILAGDWDAHLADWLARTTSKDRTRALEAAAGAEIGDGADGWRPGELEAWRKKYAARKAKT
jgi:hypothetical protein